MNSDSGAIYSCRLSSPPSVPLDFFFSFFLWAGGTGGRLKGICDLIITPSPHLATLLHPSLCRLPSLLLYLTVSLPSSLSHSLFTALFPHLSFIQSPSPLFLSVFRPSTRRSVGHDRRCVLVGGESEILYYRARRQRGSIGKQAQQNED